MMETNKPKMGRPKKAAKDRRTVAVRSMLTPAEGKEVLAAAGGSVSDWIREVILPAARAKNKQGTAKRAEVDARNVGG